MIGYITIGVSDLAKAKTFYGPLMGEYGAQPLISMERLQFYGFDMSQPMIGICTPFNQEANHPGNGNMVAIPCQTKEKVDQMYKKAIALGGTCEGEPGQRMPIFYGAYFRDPDGNKICFFKMDAPA